jgi:glycosyltransferase involved in cell wall biosynthesis
MARHTGIQLARGEYIINLDSDDMLSDGTLKILGTYCSGETDVVAFGYCRVSSVGEKLTTYLLYEGVRKFDGEDVYEWHKNIFYEYINSLCAKVYRSELLKKSLDDSFRPKTGEDIVRTLLVEPVKSAIYIGQPLYLYRVNDGSITRTYNFNKVFNWLKINRLLLRFAVMANIDTPEACIHILRKNIYTLINGILMACENTKNKEAREKLELLYSNGMCQEILLISDQLKLGFSGMVVALFKRKQFQLLYAVLFLKINENIKVKQLSDQFKTIGCVSSKPADRLCYNEVYFSVFTVSNHPKQFRSFFFFRACDALIIIKPSKFPFRVCIDVGCVMFYLCLKTNQLFIAVGGHTAVSRNPQLSLFS